MAVWAPPVAVGWLGGAARGRWRCAASLASWGKPRPGSSTLLKKKVDPVLAEIPATNPADAHSTKKFGLHQPRPSPGSPSSVTSCSTAATTSRPLARHVFDDLYGQDSVVGSDGFDGLNDGGDSDFFGY
jgi:hypothetical protein